VQEPPEEAVVEYTNLSPGGAVASAELSPGEADPKLGEALFTFGLDKLKTGNIQGGVEELTRFADENPRHARADNALYFVAVGQMSLDDLPAAAITLERVLTRYPAGDVVLDANLKLAEVRARMKRPGEARVLYEKIVSEFPGTSAATTAQARLHSLAEASPNR
jgi:TolA-binding protein